MNENKFEKTLKEVKYFAIFILALAIIVFVYNVSSNNINTIATIAALIQIALLIGTIIGCNKRMIYGPACGIVVAILSILTFNILDIIIGVAFFIDCVNLIRYMKKI